jgi:hypothetical protein
MAGRVRESDGFGRRRMGLNQPPTAKHALEQLLHRPLAGMDAADQHFRHCLIDDLDRIVLEAHHLLKIVPISFAERTLSGIELPQLRLETMLEHRNESSAQWRRRRSARNASADDALSSARLHGLGRSVNLESCGDRRRPVLQREACDEKRRTGADSREGGPLRAVCPFWCK